MKREIPDIALTLTPGIGPKGAVHLLDVFGSAEAVFSASADELIEKARLRPELARAILQKKAFADAEREVKHCRKHGIEIIASTDAQYPKPPTIRMYCMFWVPRKRSARRRLRWSARAG